MTVTKEQLIAVQDAFNNYAEAYHTVHKKAYFASRRDLSESAESESAKQALLAAGKAAGIDELAIKGAIFTVRTQTTDDKKVKFGSAEYKTTDGQFHTLFETVKSKYDELEKAEQAKMATEQAIATAEKLKEAQRQAEALRKDIIGRLSETTAIVSKGGIVNIAGKSVTQEAARIEIAKSLEGQFVDLDAEQKKEAWKQLGLAAGSEFKLLDDEGKKISNPALLAKALKYFQKNYIPDIAPDGRVGTATVEKLLKYEGVSNDIDASLVTYNVTQKIGDLGGKNFSYDLLTYDGDDAKKQAARDAMKAARALLDKIGIKSKDALDSDEPAVAMKKQVIAYQESRGLKADGVIGKRTAQALAQDDLRMTVGNGQEVNPAEILAAVNALYRKPVRELAAK